MKPVEKAILSIQEAWDNDIGVCQTVTETWAFISGYLRNDQLTGDDIAYLNEWITRQRIKGRILGDRSYEL